MVRYVVAPGQNWAGGNPFQQTELITIDLRSIRMKIQTTKHDCVAEYKSIRKH